ncbi:flagellar hook-length control protein FliK [Shewanella marina]|uniref:flagellar hook-length control protein FliK n=1 Tax=Shewanella marina TaxID=487319 RepID=UPI00131F312D|nr:flagellar hook-length control protein FliK [Shewanella marina]
MQQISNLLLGSGAGSAPLSRGQQGSSQTESSPDNAALFGDDFAKAQQQQVESLMPKNEIKSQSDQSQMAEPTVDETDGVTDDIEFSAAQQASLIDVKNAIQNLTSTTTVTSLPDEVSLVLSQINFGQQFGRSNVATDVSQLSLAAANINTSGQNLPPELQQLLNQTGLSLPQLAQVSGLSSQELSQMTPAQMSLVVEQLQPQLQQLSQQLAATMPNNTAQLQMPILGGENPLTTEQKSQLNSILKVAADGELQNMDKLAEKVSLSIEGKLVNQLKTSDVVSQQLSQLITSTPTNTSLGDSQLSSTSASATQLQQVSANRTDSVNTLVTLRSDVGDNNMKAMMARFAPVMQQQAMHMVNNGINKMEIRLDPAELGQMMIRVQVQGDQTQVQFSALQPQTRDLLEQAMPRLREMLAEQGMNLTDSGVNDGQQQNEQTNQDEQIAANHHGRDEQANHQTQSSQITEQLDDSVIDYYA